METGNQEIRKQQSTSKKAMVIGGAGFIGSNLAELLSNEGYHVIILDDLSSGKMANIEVLLKKSNTDFIQGSITDLPLLQRLLKGVDYVFHQAAIPSVPKSIENPMLSHEVNVTGTLNVLLAARDGGVKKVIFASSCAIYGDISTASVREDMAPLPNSPYAVTKLADEYYCGVFHRIYGLQTVCLRYFNVYGPRQDPNSEYAAVIPKFIRRALDGNPPVIFGDGEQTRDFIFVRDVAEANILAALSDVCGVFNIGHGKSITINQLAQIIVKLVGNKLDTIHEEPRGGDIRHSLADISKAKAFGYKPNYDLDSGLAETIKWFKAR
jgi:UDP-glucose 4-epimerase